MEAKVIAAREEERHRIARELHDVCGQELTALLLIAERLERAPDLRASRAGCRRLRERLAGVIGELDRLIRGLHPAALDDLGLVAALRRTAPAARHTGGRGRRRGAPGSLLSPRESQVLRMLGQGYNNRQMATLLHLSVKTVETFRARLSRKLGLRGRPSLVRYALRTGLLTFEQLTRSGDD